MFGPRSRKVTRNLINFNGKRKRAKNPPRFAHDMLSLLHSAKLQKTLRKIQILLIIFMNDLYKRLDNELFTH